jgi:preprotein translocase subunit YajC
VVELLPLVGIALLFWLFIIRPASRRQKELGRMQSSLSVSDEVVLTSGVFGTVTGLEDDHVLVKIAEGVEIKVARGAIGTVSRRADEETVDGSATNDEPGDRAEPEES